MHCNTCEYTLRSQVHAHGAGATGRVECDGGPMQVEVVGHAVGEYATAKTARRVVVNEARVER